MNPARMKKGDTPDAVAPLEGAPVSVPALPAAEPVKAPQAQKRGGAEAVPVRETAPAPKVEEIKGTLDPLTADLLAEIPDRPKKREAAPAPVATPEPEAPRVPRKLAALGGLAGAALLGGVALFVNARRGRPAPATSAAPAPQPAPAPPAAPQYSGVPAGVKVIG